MDQAVTGTEQNIAPAENIASHEDKLLPQEKVNELISKAKHASYEKGKREALDEYQRQAPQSMGGIQQLTEEQVRQMIADEAQRQNQNAQAQHLLDEFSQQYHAGKGKYSDFDETVSNLGKLEMIPQVVQLATSTGIAGDVMYELGKNPSKVASLMTLAYINPDLAKKEMLKLAESIKKNQDAQQVPNTHEPLSQIRPSNAGTDNGSNAVRDLRKKPWARG